MATPLQNAQFAQTLFDPLRQSVARNFDTRAAIAQREADLRLQTIRQNLLRAQALEDQQAEARLRTALQKSQNTAAAQRNRESLRFQRDRLDATEKAAARERINEAYAIYTQLGGDKKLTDFGANDDPETLYALQRTIAPLQQKRDRENAENMANFLNERRRQVMDFTKLTPDEELAAANSALDVLAGEKQHREAVEQFTKRLSDGFKVDAALQDVAKDYPAFVRAYNMQYSQVAGMMRNAKAESPEYKAAVGDLRTSTEQAFRNIRDPNVSSWLAANLTTPLPPKEKRRVLESPDALGGGKGEGGGGAKTRNSDAASASNLINPAGYGGASGFIGAVADRIKPAYNAVDSAGNIAASYTFAPVLRGLNLIGGGMKRVNEQDAARDAYMRGQRERLRQALVMFGAGESPVAPVTQAPATQMPVASENARQPLFNLTAPGIQ